MKLLIVRQAGELTIGKEFKRLEDLIVSLGSLLKFSMEVRENFYFTENTTEDTLWDTIIKANHTDMIKVSSVINVILGTNVFIMACNSIWKIIGMLQ
jgi:hypothetical protein